jgi:Peptidase family M1 domain
VIRRILVLLLAAAPVGAATPIRPRVVEYTIEVSLEPQSKTLDGKEHLVWRNPSGDAVSELRFHLYLNAFKNNRTTFMRESGGQLRGDEAGKKASDWGWIDVTSLRSADGADLKAGARLIQPDGNDASDETVLLVPLPAPVPPHGEIALDIAFRAKLPRVFARTGYVRDYFLVGQWYPKIGVYEPAGLRGRAAGGWNCHAFHANSEFYADYGRFDVTMIVPPRFVVGATGKRVSEKAQGDRTSYRYVQDDVHDFAWTADPRFVVVDFPFEPASDVPAGWSAKAAKELGMTEADIALKPVSCRLLLQPGHMRAKERYLRSTREAISFYGLWFGAYPYETLTVVDPPDDAEGSGGMEYPTFITGGEANAWLTRWPFARVRGVEIVTLHEFGHQYWYGMVGSNEFEESWLDEGLNTDSEYRAMGMAYGPRDTLQLPGGFGTDAYSLAHAEYRHLTNLDPIHACAWCFASDRSYAVNSYPKVGLFMAQLKHDLGADVFARAQRAYFQEWSFRHPDTKDFFDVFERVSGRDLSTYRRNLVDGRARLDWQVVSAKSSKLDRDYGIFEHDGTKEAFEDGEPVAGHGGNPSKKLYGTLVLFGNTGDWDHDVKARMVFSDGTSIDRTLPAGARWVKFRIRYASKLAYAVVDPDRENLWDWNRLNDSKVLATGKGAAATLGHRAFVKYSAWVSYLGALWSQVLWGLA